MSDDRPKNLIEEGQVLARKLMASRSTEDLADGIIVRALVAEAEVADQAAALWRELELRNCYRPGRGRRIAVAADEHYVVCACGAISKLLAKLKKVLTT